MLYSLQTSVVIDDKEFHITNDGDFRMVLDCFSALQDEELSEDLRVLASLLIFYNEFNSVEDIQANEDIAEDLVKEMFKFFNSGHEQTIGAVIHRPVIDWNNDSTIICSAINNVAKQEIRSLPYLHWWTFLGYYMSIGESVLATVVGIRTKLLNGTKLDKWEQKFKRDNPSYFVWNSSTIADREAENLIRELWNKGGES